MKYLLTKIQTNLLAEITSDASIKAKTLEILNFGNFQTESRCNVDVNETEIEQILDDLTNAFLRQGVNPSYEPNEYGLRIEGLIDIFNNYE